MIFVFDLDETLCVSNGRDYEHAMPVEDMVREVNALYDLGKQVMIMTGRGSTSGIDRRELTVQQLREWDVRHHSLRFVRKPLDYLYVDDKACSPAEFLQQYAQR